MALSQSALSELLDATRAAGPYGVGADHSFFRDLLAARSGEGSAIQRLTENERAVAAERPETRAGTTGATSFGSFVPPVWLLDEFAGKARAGRVVPDLARASGPPTSTSMTIPRVTTGGAVAIQNPENTTLGTVDAVTAPGASHRPTR